jgi:RHS repeat-associated protein
VSYDGVNALHQGYKPWGETRFGEVPTPYQFTGQYRQASLGLDFFNARWYDPGLSRWTSPDSIIPDPVNSLEWDRFSYTKNNPIRYRDPSGHWAETVLDLLFITYDVYQIMEEGWTPVNTVALVADIACAIVPIGTGGGPAVRAIMAGSDAALAFTKTATTLPDAIRAGQVLEKIFQFASSSSKDSSKDLQGHHPWPKYLLGPETQELYGLDKKLHTEYHAQLDKFLDRKLGQEYFLKLIDTPEKLNELLEALLEFNKYFDDTYDTHTYEALEDVLRELGYLP